MKLEERVIPIKDKYIPADGAVLVQYVKDLTRSVLIVEVIKSGIELYRTLEDKLAERKYRAGVNLLVKADRINRHEVGHDMFIVSSYDVLGEWTEL